MNGWSNLEEDFANLCETYIKEVKDAAVEIAIDSLTTPFMNNGLAPVKTGNWLANNLGTVNTYTNAYNNIKDTTGTDTKDKLLSSYRSSKSVYDTFTIQNNTEYNSQVEYKGWAVREPYQPYFYTYQRITYKVATL